MSTEGIDIAAFIAAVEAKRAALDALLASLRAAAAVGALGAVGDIPAGAAQIAGSPGTPTLHNGEIPAGAFLAKSIPEAAKLYLELVKKKQTSTEIAEALKKGGMESTSKNFASIVHSILDRARKNPNSGILKLDRSYWGLAAWYPAGLRATATAVPAKKNSKKKKQGRKPASSKQREEKAEAEPKATAPSIPEPQAVAEKAHIRIERLLRANAHGVVSADYLAEKTGLARKDVYLAVGVLASKKIAEKTEGGYRLRQSAPAESASTAVV
jgi:hypothetical protein